MKLRRVIAALSLLCCVERAEADVLCKVKKTGEVIARPAACAKKEIAIASLATTTTSTSATPDVTIGTDLNVSDTGAVASGADATIGLDLSVNRLGAKGGNISTTGLNLSVIGDTGGDSTNVGLSVLASGADTNYCAIFQGGNVGIGLTDPDEALEIAGRLHLGSTSAPANVAEKLYNSGGTLYWAGQPLSTGTPSSSGGISAVVAGSGLTGGGSSGAVTLSVDSGTTAGKLVQLNGNAELPAVSGANLSSLNASSIDSGTISDSRLSGNVSLLGSSIGLSSEVSGVLPVANGGTGATTLTDLVTLGTHTSGNYVASLTSGTGVTIGGSAGEGSAHTASIDQAFTPSWTGVHTFQSGLNVGTATSTEKLHLNGRLHIDQGSAPGDTTDRLYNVGGALYFNGLNISSNALGGDITGVTVGTGLTGGGTSGAVTINADVGTSANQIVQLNGAAQLPAVNGVNLTALNASNIASGTVADARLSTNVSLLGSSIGLSTEVTGVLPISNGGTGATSFANLFALGTDTTGSYVGSVSAGTGIAVTPGAAEGGSTTVAVDQTFSPTWSATHTFSGVALDITTGTNEHLNISPNGTGKVGIGTSSPSGMLDTVFSSSSASAATDVGSAVNVTDTGAVTSGTDSLFGIDVNVARSGATGGTIDATGIDISVTNDGGGAGATTSTGLRVSASGADTNYAALFTGGYVGIGTSTPTAPLESLLTSTSTTAGVEKGAKMSVNDTGVVTSGVDTTTALDIQLTRTGATGGAINSNGVNISVTADAAGAGSATATGLSVSVSGGDSNIAATFGGGSVGVGAAIATLADADIPSGSIVVGNGALCVDNLDDDCGSATRNAGTIYADNSTVTGIDLAEEFPLREGEGVEAGEIVVIDSSVAAKCVERGVGADGTRVCIRSVQGYVPFVRRSSGSPAEGKRILGVVSTKPGVTLGGFGTEELFQYAKAPIALAGRIPVKVNDENGAIEIGDRLTPSHTPGVGMKANEGDVVVGIALEPLEGSAGSILVLTK